MDSFTAGVFVWLVSLGLAFMVGQLWPLDGIRKDCIEKGESTVRNTVIQCKPTATIIEGKRITFVE